MKYRIVKSGKCFYPEYLGKTFWTRKEKWSPIFDGEARAEFFSLEDAKDFIVRADNWFSRGDRSIEKVVWESE